MHTYTERSEIIYSALKTIIIIVGEIIALLLTFGNIIFFFFFKPSISPITLYNE